jgi:hypothetical protein
MRQSQTPNKATVSSSAVVARARATAEPVGVRNTIRKPASSAAIAATVAIAKSLRYLQVARTLAHAADQAAELGASGIWKTHVVSCNGRPCSLGRFSLMTVVLV